jgi:hypothetical protein
VRRLLALGVTAVLAGCGTPHELSKQAEDVHSVAAEGALLAHETSEGDSTTSFTREHARALRKLLSPLRAAIEDERLGDVADSVDRTLSELAGSPGDEELAADAQRELQQLADDADELAK